MQKHAAAPAARRRFLLERLLTSGARSFRRGPVEREEWRAELIDAALLLYIQRMKWPVSMAAKILRTFRTRLPANKLQQLVIRLLASIETFAVYTRRIYNFTAVTRLSLSAGGGHNRTVRSWRITIARIFDIRIGLPIDACGRVVGFVT